MPENVLTKEIAIDSLRKFFREKPFIVIGTGMSCAIDDRFGMTALAKELIQKVGELCSSARQNEEWKAVESAIKNGTDLESSLNNVADEALLQHIITVTSYFITSIDREYALKIANCEIAWPAINLIKILVTALPEGDRALNILTPNYDMLLEYACDCESIPYTNGFVGGVERKLDWECALRSLAKPERVMYGRTLKNVSKLQKHIRLYKVHGSLNVNVKRNCTRCDG